MLPEAPISTYASCTSHTVTTTNFSCMFAIFSFMGTSSPPSLCRRDHRQVLGCFWWHSEISFTKDPNASLTLQYELARGSLVPSPPFPSKRGRPQACSSGWGSHSSADSQSSCSLDQGIRAIDPTSGIGEISPKRRHTNSSFWNMLWMK